MYAGISATWDSLLGGSMSVRASAAVTLGPEVILDDLPILGGSLTKSSDGRQIQQRLQLSVVDEDGALMRGPSSPLMPFGQEIILRAGLADKGSQETFAEMLPMGVFGIDSPEATNAVPWRMYPNGAWLVSGGAVTVNASDGLAQVNREDFTTAERPALSATVRSETERLLQDRMPVAETWAAGVADTTPVARSVTYDNSRLATLLNLAEMAGGVAWANRSGGYELLKQERQTVGVWRLAVTDPFAPDDRGALVEWVPDVNRDSLYNAVIINSEDTIGNPLRGVAYEISGPLAWGGPFGQVPFTEENRLAKSNAQCQTFAEQRLAQTIAGRSITARVKCLPNMALDPLDTIELVVPNRTIYGLVTSITYPLGPGLMEMDVSIPFTDWIIPDQAVAYITSSSFVDEGFGVGPFGALEFGGVA